MNNFNAALDNKDFLYKMAIIKTQDINNAQELVQDTLIKAYRFWDRFDGDNCRAWLITIMNNTFINKWKAQQRLPQRLSMVDAAHNENPDVILDRKEAYNKAQDIINILPEDWKTAIKLFYFDGYTHKEIAKMTNVPIGTIKSRIYRGIKVMKRKYTER